MTVPGPRSGPDDLDHPAIGPAVAILRALGEDKALRESTSSLGRQGFVEVRVALAAMLPASQDIADPVARCVHAAVHARRPDQVAAALQGRDRTAVRGVALALAHLVPADIDPARALAWVDQIPK